MNECTHDVCLTLTPIDDHSHHIMEYSWIFFLKNLVSGNKKKQKKNLTTVYSLESMPWQKGDVCVTGLDIIINDH